MNPVPQIDRSCPLCETVENKLFLRKKDLALVQCVRCSMIYANPVPAEMTTGSFYNDLGTPFYLSPDKLDSDYANVRFERELRLFRRFCTGGNVLDVGCSTGAFLYQLKTRFPGDYKVLGTDVSKPALEYARSRGVEIVDEFLNFNFGEQKFDAITFWAVMEHLLNPKQFLAKAASLLNAGGHCFILVPNMKSLAVRLLGAKYRYIMPEHLNYFTASTLKNFGESANGLEIAATGSMHFNPLVMMQDWKGRGDYVSDQSRAALLKKTTAYKRNPSLKPVKFAYEKCEVVLGKLNLADNLFIVLRKPRDRNLP